MNLPLLPTQEIGSLRKPEYLVLGWKKYLRGEIEYKELRPLIRRASKRVLKFLENIGIDIIWDGEMHRWEMYHHPISNIEGIEKTGLVKVFDNTYYMKGNIVSKPKATKNYHLEELIYVKAESSKPIKIPVTGPYTLVDWSYNEYYNRKWMKIESDRTLIGYNAKREASLHIARQIINPILTELSKHSPYRIQIDEPAATSHPSEIEIFIEAFNEAVEGVEEIVNLHICYGDYTPILPYLDQLKTRQLTLEFANRDSWNRGVDDDERKGYHFLKELKEHSYEGEIGLGVIDVHTKKIEPIELIQDRIEYALKYLDVEKIFINPDCGLRSLPNRYAKAKLKNMVCAVKRIRNKLGMESP